MTGLMREIDADDESMHAMHDRFIRGTSARNDMDPEEFNMVPIAARAASRAGCAF